MTYLDAHTKYLSSQLVASQRRLKSLREELIAEHIEAVVLLAQLGDGMLTPLEAAYAANALDEVSQTVPVHRR